MTRPLLDVRVRPTRREDFASIIALSRAVYSDSIPWNEAQLASHLEVFPEGQFVAVAGESGEVAGMAASLIVSWNDYDINTSWRDFTNRGMFTNHDPERGRTLYGAEIMVHPEFQRRGVGSRLYDTRRDLVRRLGLRRIRAGARLRGYHAHAARMGAEEYAARVARGEIHDPTVSFQIRRGFQIVAVVSGYLRHDPESLGYAAIIEWLNPGIARVEDRAGREARLPGL